ncbi:MAG: 2OG-Fe(II) oxygenase family protein, partial [Actinomycetota bacterium]
CRLGEPGVATVESLGAEDHPVWSRPNVWPTEVPGFRETWLDYYGVLESLSATLMRLFALGLGLDEGYFDDKIDDHVTNLVVNYYPPVDGEPEPGQYRKGPHSDWGTLTVLWQDETGGLEVLDRDADEWVPVPVLPGSFVVNVGDLMEVWTNDRWRSTKHRVPVPPVEHRQVPRVSMPFFHQPNWLADVECIPSCLAPGEEPTHEPVQSGQYLLHKIQTAYH